MGSMMVIFCRLLGCSMLFLLMLYIRLIVSGSLDDRIFTRSSYCCSLIFPLLELVVHILHLNYSSYFAVLKSGK